MHSICKVKNNIISECVWHVKIERFHTCNCGLCVLLYVEDEKFKK